MLLDPHRGWCVANRVDDVLRGPPCGSRRTPRRDPCLRRRVPHHAAPDGRRRSAELARLRQALDDALRDNFGLRAAVAGTHPTRRPAEVAVPRPARATSDIERHDAGAGAS